MLFGSLDPQDLWFASITCGGIAVAARLLERNKYKKKQSYAFQLFGLLGGLLMLAAIFLGLVGSRGPME